MRKLIKSTLLMLFLILGLSACSKQEPTTTTADNDLLEEEGIERVQSASDVYQTGDYYFAVNDEVLEKWNTYKKENNLMIKANDEQTYYLYQSTEEISDYKELDPVEFTGEKEVEISGLTYFVLVGNTGEIDVTISTN